MNLLVIISSVKMVKIPPALLKNKNFLVYDVEKYNFGTNFRPIDPLITSQNEIFSFLTISSVLYIL